MRQQRNIFKIKEQDKTTEQLSEVEIGNLLKKEFRIIIVKMLQDLRKKMKAEIKKIQEIFNKELEDLKAEMNNTISEMKNALEKNQQQDK